ncbi:MAG: hypothetical protein ACOH1K_07015 [Rhodoglobus sp.]
MSSSLLVRFASVVGVAVLAASASLVGVASPAQAATTVHVTDGATLQSAVTAANANSDSDLIYIDNDIIGLDLLLEVTQPLSIYLQDFTVSSVRLRASANLTMYGQGGNWVAGTSTTPDSAAAPGIGISSGATLWLSDINLEAVGTFCDAAIGGWNTSASGCDPTKIVDPGTIQITSSIVTVRGGSAAAAVGGGYLSSAGDISILSSTVQAFAGEGGALIGNENSTGPGSNTLTMANSTLSGMHITMSAILNSGTNRLLDDVEVDVDLTNNGDIHLGGELFGSGNIINNGIILPGAYVSGLTVTVNSYVVNADPNSADADPATITKVNVYAYTLKSGGSRLPDPRNKGRTLQSWNTAADGSGTELTDTTDLRPLVDSLKKVTVYAIWGPAVTTGGTTSPASTSVLADTGSNDSGHPIVWIALALLLAGATLMLTRVAAKR